MLCSRISPSMFISSCFNRSFIANADSENNKQQIIAAHVNYTLFWFSHRRFRCRPFSTRAQISGLQTPPSLYAQIITSRDKNNFLLHE